MLEIIVVRVFSLDGAWHSQLGEIETAAYVSKTAALNGAVDIANLIGRMGHPAQVALEETSGKDIIIWTFGTDFYPPQF